MKKGEFLFYAVAVTAVVAVAIAFDTWMSSPYYPHQRYRRPEDK